MRQRKTPERKRIPYIVVDCGDRLVFSASNNKLQEASASFYRAPSANAWQIYLLSTLHWNWFRFVLFYLLHFVRLASDAFLSLPSFLFFFVLAIHHVLRLSFLSPSLSPRFFVYIFTTVKATNKIVLIISG